MVHVHLDRVAFQRLAEAVQRRLQPRLGHHLRPRLQQREQQGEFAPAQADRLAGLFHAVGGGVHHQVAVLDHRPAAPGSAAQHGAQPRQQLVGIEGLDDVVVGTTVQPGDAVVDAVARGHDQHRQVRVRQRRGARAALPAAANARQQVQALAVGQAQVQQHRVEGLHAQRRPGRRERAAHIHGITRLPQRGRQATGDTGIVFHHQNAHVVLRARPAVAMLLHYLERP